MLPVRNSRVNISLLEPVLTYRLKVYFDEVLRRFGFSIGSGVRTEEHQRRLYNSWLRLLPGFNRAANPDRVIGVSPDGIVFRGSYHMQQSDGHGHAVDLHRPPFWSRARADRLVRETARHYGLAQTVPGEWWHLQARSVRGYFLGPFPTAPQVVSEDMETPFLIHGADIDRYWIVDDVGEGGRRMAIALEAPGDDPNQTAHGLIDENDELQVLTVPANSRLLVGKVYRA